MMINKYATPPQQTYPFLYFSGISRFFFFSIKHITRGCCDLSRLKVTSLQNGHGAEAKCKFSGCSCYFLLHIKF